MTNIVIDERTSAQFKGVPGTRQVVDEAGQILGMFTPNVDPHLLKPQIDEKEIQRRISVGGGRPLEEILRDLEKQAG